MPVSNIPLFAFHLFAALMVLSQTACSQSDTATPKELNNILLEQPLAIETFELTTQYGTEFTVENFKNHWTFLFFGYTHCPDICPTTLTELALLAQRMPQNNKFQFVFVSVDPDRDTPEHLKEYIAYFNEQFVGLTGQMDKINTLTKQLNIKYAKEPAVDGNYAVNHSSAVLLVDPQGRYVARFNAPHYAEVMLGKFELLKNFVQPGPQT
jgi:protein SCO1/2